MGHPRVWNETFILSWRGTLIFQIFKLAEYIRRREALRKIVLFCSSKRKALKDVEQIPLNPHLTQNWAALLRLSPVPGRPHPQGAWADCMDWKRPTPFSCEGMFNILDWEKNSGNSLLEDKKLLFGWVPRIPPLTDILDNPTLQTSSTPSTLLGSQVRTQLSFSLIGLWFHLSVTDINRDPAKRRSRIRIRIIQRGFSSDRCCLWRQGTELVTPRSAGRVFLQKWK